MKNFTEQKMWILISLQLLSEIFVILKRIQRAMIKNAERSSCKVPVILVRYYGLLEGKTCKRSRIVYHKIQGDQKVSVNLIVRV
jgi:hypothetical protein